MFKKRLSFCIIFILFSLPLQASRWSYTGVLNIPRRGYGAALLTDGRVIVMEGCGAPATYEIFSPATGAWVYGTLSGNSSTHTIAMLLQNGKVFYVSDTGTLSQTFIYDPHSETWNHSSVTLQWAEYGHATLLKDGKLLLMHGKRECGFYDYALDSLIPTGSSNEVHTTGVEVLLPTGEVLAIGGDSTNTCEIFDPVSEQWQLTASIFYNRARFPGVLLPPPWNKVLVAGGEIGTPQTEIYDITSRTWSTTGILNSATRRASAAALLPSGQMFLVGGDYSEYCEIYDNDLGQWSLTDNLIYDHAHFSLTVLPTGKIMAIGGLYSLGSNSPYCEIYDPSTGIWDDRSSLQTARAAHTLTTLPIIHTSGCSTNILITGGINSAGVIKSCELYNYQRDSIFPTGFLNEARAYHTANLLVSGQVLVTGGKGSSGNALNSCEIFDVPTETWSSTGSMKYERFNHTSTLSPSGDIIVTGGENSSGYLNSCEIFNGSSWDTINSMGTARTYHTAVLLQDGKIMVIGGKTSTGATASCEIWDGTNWVPAASLSNARYWHTSVLLQSGKVLVIGGTSGKFVALSSCEIYDPVTNMWRPEGNLNKARYLHNTVLLYSGLVLVIGGHTTFNYVGDCEIWDPAAELNLQTNIHNWKITDTLDTGLAYHSSVLIPSDKPYVFTIGGMNSSKYLNSNRRYDVGLGYRNEWQSTIMNFSSITRIADSMHIEGSLFRGVSEADGGDHCHAISNDHPIISIVREGGGNWQGNGGGAMLYMPPSTSWDTGHTDVYLPPNAPAGYYKLWSIVNGIPCKWYQECISGAEEKESTGQEAENSKHLSLKVSQNPFITSTTIEYKIPIKTAVSLKIYDVSGKLVKSLVDKIDEPGYYRIELNAKDLSTGVYFIKLNAGDCKKSQKITLIK